ncbi:hypothetical protein Y032_0154g3018 [Ancylostoma ceylanicum]|uniref:Uncharacterized protein n=1 Tax=Ancylostoma ceylanicum TaxID=53326 RepID=A0A016T041_9BILA|nr:hypothetical protein Y032_0154g3018 [Ancylostoma ceylanicum]
MWILFVLVVTAFAAKPTTIEEFLARPKTEPAQPLTGQALVDYVNEQQSFFQAEYNQQAEELAKFRLMEPEFLVKPKKEEVLSDVYGDEPPESLQLLKKILASGIHARLLRHAAPPALSYVLRHGSVDAQGSGRQFSFDARDHWKDCKSIGTIRDQSACGMSNEVNFFFKVHVGQFRQRKLCRINCVCSRTAG